MAAPMSARLRLPRFDPRVARPAPASAPMIVPTTITGTEMLGVRSQSLNEMAPYCLRSTANQKTGMAKNRKLRNVVE